MSIDQTVSDFDGVTFHISTPEAKSRIMVSLQIRCFQDLLRYGAEEVLNREYGPYVVPPEPGYDFSIVVDLENLPADKGWSCPSLAPASLPPGSPTLDEVQDTKTRHYRGARRARQENLPAEAQRHGCPF